MATENTVYSIYHTVADTATAAATDNLPFHDINIHVEDFDIQYGNARNVTAVAKAGSVLSFTNGNIRDFLFKNNNAGDTAHLSIVATLKEA